MLTSWSNSEEAAKKPQLNFIIHPKTADPTLTFVRPGFAYPMFKVYRDYTSQQNEFYPPLRNRLPTKIRTKGITIFVKRTIQEIIIIIDMSLANIAVSFQKTNLIGHKRIATPRPIASNSRSIELFFYYYKKTDAQNNLREENYFRGFKEFVHQGKKVVEEQSLYTAVTRKQREITL